MKTRLIATLLATTLIGAAVYAADAPVSAATYTKQAAEFRATAERHDKMAQMHKAGAGSQKVGHENIVKHCEQIAKDLRAAADESDALAADLKAEEK